MSTSFSASSESALLHTSLTWTIDHFSYRDTCVVSPDFTDEKKNTFFLELYPNKIGFVNLSIIMIGKKPTRIKYKLSLSNSHGQSRLLYDQTGGLTLLYRHSYGSVGISIPQFISSTDLLKPSNEYLPGDTLTLHCEIVHLDNEKTTIKAVPSQADTMAKVFGTLMNDYDSLLKSGNLADVKLIVGGKTFLAHKLILIARSSVFAAMFNQDMKENLENQVEITDIKPEVFESLLFFLYTGAMPTLKSIKSAEELLIAADKYDAEQLKNICENFLATKLTIKTVPDLFLLANSVNADKLKESVLEFMRGRGNELFDAIQNEPDKLENLFQWLSSNNQEEEYKFRVKLLDLSLLIGASCLALWYFTRKH